MGGGRNTRIYKENVCNLLIETTILNTKTTEA